MTLTDREKALVEAARKFKAHPYDGGWPEVEDALRAYDPPKQKVPVLPEWQLFVAMTVTPDGEFIGGGLPARYVRNSSVLIEEDVYNAIRELTAKDSE